MTLKELIARIKIAATQTGVVDEASPFLDSEMLIEVILPRALQIIVEEAMKDSFKINALHREFEILIFAGFGNLPAELDESFAYTFEITPQDGVSPRGASYIAQYEDYYNRSNSLVSTFYVGGGLIHFRPAGATVTDYSDGIVVNAVAVPKVPDLLADTVVMDAELIEKLIAFTAAVIRGEIPLASVGLGNTANVPRPSRRREAVAEAV